jgi:hypothetical protein
MKLRSRKLVSRISADHDVVENHDAETSPALMKISRR